MVSGKLTTRFLLGTTLLMAMPACALAQQADATPPPSPSASSPVSSPDSSLASSLASYLASSSTPPSAGATQGGAIEPLTKDKAETYRLLKLFADVFERARMQYVEPVEDKVLIEAAINGMLTHLDPHSEFLGADAWEDMRVQNRGTFGGLGIEVSMENGAVKVISPIDDTPASKAGLMAGDLIIELDDKAVMGLSLQEAVDKMRGEPGTNIKLTIIREGVGKPIHVTLTRAIIKVESVKWRAEGDVGYIRITKFNNRTQSGLEQAIKELKKQIGNDKLRGWVLDLRNNPGGLLEQAVSVTDSFLDKGEIVATRARDPKDSMKFDARAGDLADGKPVVVLINAGSASASEIVAGALQDHRRALVLGVKSFGKGSVQTLIPLEDNVAMKITTARYYTPSGRSIQAEGIVPDIEVHQAHVEVIDDNGLNLRESNLHGALDNDKKDESATGNKAQPAGETPKENEAKNGKTNDDTKREEDFQLSRAIDMVHGLWLYSHAGQSVVPPAKSVASEDKAKNKGDN